MCHGWSLTIPFEESEWLNDISSKSFIKTIIGKMKERKCFSFQIHFSIHHTPLLRKSLHIFIMTTLIIYNNTNDVSKVQQEGNLKER